MTAKKTSAKKPADLTDAELSAEIDQAAAPEMVTIYHPDVELNRSREVPKDKLERWEAQGWLTQAPDAGDN